MKKKVQKNQQRQPTQRRSQETCEAILKASAQILLKEGLPGLNSNAIAKKAGVSVGSFYQYYANKEAVLSDLIKGRMNHLLEQMNNAFSGESSVDQDRRKNPRDFLKKLLITLLHEFKKDQLLALLMFQYSHVIADQNRMEKVDQDMVPMIVAAIQEAVPDLRKPKLETAVFVMLQSYRGIVAVSSARRFKGIDIEELAEEVTDLFWRYLSNDMVT